MRSIRGRRKSSASVISPTRTTSAPSVPAVSPGNTIWPGGAGRLWPLPTTNTLPDEVIGDRACAVWGGRAVKWVTMKEEAWKALHRYWLTKHQDGRPPSRKDLD